MRRLRRRTAMPRKRIADLAIVLASLAIVAVLAISRAGRNDTERSAPSTYDTGVNGYAAVYDLLAREGDRVGRFELPIGELGQSPRTLVLAGDGALDAAAPSVNVRADLNGWVLRGGRLVVLDGSVSRAAAEAFGMPHARRVQSGLARTACAFVSARRGARVAADFTAAYPTACTRRRATLLQAASSAMGIVYRRGRGSITLVGTATVFDNLHLAQRANASVAYAVLGGGPIVFDERVHGYVAGRTFWEVLPAPMRIALGLGVLAGLLAVAGANLPFAPPLNASEPEERDSGAYITSLARMLERGGAAREAVAVIVRRCERALGARAPGDERARMLLRELRTVESSPRPGASDVLQAGRIFARVRKEYGC